MLREVVLRPARSLRETATAYFRLTKPRIIVLLLITTVPAMILAAEGLPSPWLVLATLAGGSLAAGGANALNCYFDRDIDSMMVRTRGRPVPAGQVEPEKVVTFGIVLGGAGLLILEAFANLVAAFLAAGALAFYVVVYTLLLKRTTPHNIVIGGAAGAMPPLVGWAAVTGHLEPPALILFAIILYWTPPHFWSLALLMRDDYERASVPMLPVVRGEQETKRQILLYSLLLFAVTVLLYSTGATGYLYLGSALALGGAFVLLALRLYRDSRPRAAEDLFRYSVLYLALLFAAIAVDQLTVA